jgi:hypothetical protein
MNRKLFLLRSLSLVRSDKVCNSSCRFAHLCCRSAQHNSKKRRHGKTSSRKNKHLLLNKQNKSQQNIPNKQEKKKPGQEGFVQTPHQRQTEEIEQDRFQSCSTWLPEEPPQSVPARPPKQDKKFWRSLPKHDNCVCCNFVLFFKKQTTQSIISPCWRLFQQKWDDSLDQRTTTQNGLR